jgi:hypothetical protein
MIVNYPEKKPWPFGQYGKGSTPYEKNCAACHGADEKGNPVFAKTLGEKELNIVGKETKQKSDEALLKVSLKARARCRRTRSLPKMNKGRCCSTAVLWRNSLECFEPAR